MVKIDVNEAYRELREPIDINKPEIIIARWPHPNIADLSHYMIDLSKMRELYLNHLEQKVMFGKKIVVVKSVLCGVDFIQVELEVVG